MPNRSYLLALFAAVMLLLIPAYAQQTTGIVIGQVTDTSGAVVPNVPVTITSSSTGLVRTAQTNNQGAYSFQDVPIGVYQVEVAAPNFQSFVTKNVQVLIASTTTVNAQLQVGGSTQTVVVQESNVQVQTDSASLGAVIDGTQVKELPLNGRNFVELTQLSPGVSAANGFVTQGKGLNGGVDMSVNGNPTTNNLFLIDGVSNNDTGSNRTILIYPSNEAIAEFKFLTNTYGAQYGQASGGIINIATRSGSNKFHGSLFYDGRNDALAAYDYFTSPNAGKGRPHDGKAKLRRNDWGYSIGGPIKKDKLFFFFSEEWNHQIQGRQVSACVPTAAEIGGDFSSPSCITGNVVFPANVATKPGNPHALAAVDPSATAILKLFPAPNSALNANGQNWSQAIPTALFWREENVRVDYNVTPRNSVFGRYTQDAWTNPAFNAGYWGDDPFPALNSSWAQPSKSIVGRWTSTISNTMVNSAAFQYSNNRIVITAGGTNPGLLPQITAAVPTLYPSALKHSALGLAPTNLGNYGSGNTLQLIAPWQNQLDIYSAVDDLSKVTGRHVLKFGTSLDWAGKNEDVGPSTSERPNVNTANTNIAAGGTQVTNNLANFEIPGNQFLLSENSTNVRALLRWRDYEFYASDNFKLTPRLTLDAGVRYSIMTPTFHPTGQMTSFQPQLYDPSKPKTDACNGLWVVPGQDPCGTSNKKFGTNFSSGVPGPNKYLVNVNHHLFAPRVGFAWDVFGNGKTALRGGAGQFFQRERISRYQLVSNAPFVINASNVARSLGGATPASLAGGTASPSGGYDPKSILPNSWQWNLTAEQSLNQNTVFSLSYVGNRGIHLTSSYDINQISPQNWQAASFSSGDAQNKLRPYPNYGSLAWWTHDGNSNYNSLQTLMRTRVGKLQLQLAYTWSHSIADVVLDDSSGTGTGTRTYFRNPHLDRGNGATNRPNNFVANATYFLPLLTGHNILEQGALGGWELTAITSAANGNSFTIYQGVGENTSTLVANATSTLSSLTQTGFTNMLRPLTTGQSCTAGRHGNTIINPGAFTLVGYKIGTLPANLEPRGFCGGPNFYNTDLAVDKNWKVKEMATIQFRLNFFNLLNHANFNPGSLSSGSPFQNVNCGAPQATGYLACSATNNVVSTATQTAGFGTSNNLIGNSRQIQYELHINF